LNGYDANERERKMNRLLPKMGVSPQSLEFARSLPPMPSTFNCRFLYPADARDTQGVREFAPYPGRYTSTLNFFDPNAPIDQLIRMLDYQKSVGSTCFPALNFNDDGKMYPTIGNKRGAPIDENELDRCYAYSLAAIQTWGLWPIPGGFCCEDNNGYARKDAVEIERVVKALVTKLDPVVPFWCIAWEASKMFTPSECELLAQIYRKYTNRPIIIHNQGWEHAVGPSIQGLAYEWHHHPMYGQTKSSAQIKAEYQDAYNNIVPRGKGLIAGEWTVFSQTDEAADQRKAVREVGPWTYGSWN